MPGTTVATLGFINSPIALRSVRRRQYVGGDINSWDGQLNGRERQFLPKRRASGGNEPGCVSAKRRKTPICVGISRIVVSTHDVASDIQRLVVSSDD